MCFCEEQIRIFALFQRKERIDERLPILRRFTGPGTLKSLRDSSPECIQLFKATDALMSPLLTFPVEDPAIVLALATAAVAPFL